MINENSENSKNEKANFLENTPKISCAYITASKIENQILKTEKATIGKAQSIINQTIKEAKMNYSSINENYVNQKITNDENKTEEVKENQNNEYEDEDDEGYEDGDGIRIVPINYELKKRKLKYFIERELMLMNSKYKSNINESIKELLQSKEKDYLHLFKFIDKKTLDSLDLEEEIKTKIIEICSKDNLPNKILDKIGSNESFFTKDIIFEKEEKEETLVSDILKDDIFNVFPDLDDEILNIIFQMYSFFIQKVFLDYLNLLTYLILSPFNSYKIFHFIFNLFLDLENILSNEKNYKNIPFPKLFKFEQKIVKFENEVHQ